MNKQLFVSVVFCVLLIIGAVWFVSSRPNTNVGQNIETSMAEIINGKQIVNVVAKGGYSPRSIDAKAGMPTVLRITTNNTFDCSASLVIPKLSYQKFLQPSGIEEVSIPAEQAEGTIQGLCSMGMYNFRVVFK